MKLPDMHRIETEAEWHSVPVSEWNNYQKFADKHGEWATPANLISAIGAVSTVSGLVLIGNSNNTSVITGVAAIGFGRAMDIMDGYVAAKTGTKSPTGEKVDAGVDTALMVGALAILMKNGTFPEAQGIATAAITATKMVFTGIAQMRNNETHVSRAGKLGVFGLWGGIGSYAIEKMSNVLEYPSAGNLFHSIGNVTLGAGLVLSAIAANDYRKNAYPKTRKLPKA